MRSTVGPHTVTDPMTLPYADIGQSPRPKRSVPVAVIYDLKSQAKPDDAAPGPPAQSNASQGSMFFRGRSRSIKNDPFLQRLSRLK